MMLAKKSSIYAGLAVFSLALMHGCGGKPDTEKLAPAALVNGQVVAAAQIEKEMAKLGQVPPDQSQTVANRILKNVLDQELLAQQAVQAKLNDKPEIEMKIAAARRQILAEAQIEAMAKDMAAPGEAEIKAYFDAHPELFANRKVYKLQELYANTTPDKVEQARELAKQVRNPRELAAALAAKGIQVGGRELVKAAEELPADVLKRLAGMKPGQSISVVKGDKLDVIFLAGAEDRPVPLEKASTMIARYLLNSGKRELVAGEIEKLRGKAKIEYTPPYAALADKAANEAKP